MSTILGKENLVLWEIGTCKVCKVAKLGVMCWLLVVYSVGVLAKFKIVVFLIVR